ncbi:MAG: hypothetical protein OEL20_05185 [Sulfuritalea sp.]|nr:hypothetical protein [Sulfuritalea sp.]
MGITSWRTHGTEDFGDWAVGEHIANIAQLQVGDILFKDSAQFNALNLCRVTRINEEMGNRAYATFINPRNPSEGRIGAGPEPEFCIWDFELPECAFGNRFLRAVCATAQAA